VGGDPDQYAAFLAGLDQLDPLADAPGAAGGLPEIEHLGGEGASV